MPSDVIVAKEVETPDRPKLYGALCHHRNEEWRFIVLADTDPSAFNVNPGDVIFCIPGSADVLTEAKLRLEAEQWCKDNNWEDEWADDLVAFAKSLPGVVEEAK